MRSKGDVYMIINLKVRLKNKSFWVSMIPAVLLLIQVVLAPFGVDVTFGALSEQLLAIVNAVFVLLTILGVVNDPTIEGFHDSEKAMEYTSPCVNCKDSKKV